MANKILLVEDDANVSELYKEILTEGGYVVDIADNGDSAKEKINGADWDLLLLDIMLPKLDGLEILKYISEVPVLKTKPIIVLSALEKREIVEKSLALGAREYLVKSNIYPNDLLTSISKYLVKEEK